MLALSRKKDEAIVINNNVAVVISNFIFSLELSIPLDKELIPVLFTNEFFNKINKLLIINQLHKYIF